MIQLENGQKIQRGIVPKKTCGGQISTLKNIQHHQP